MQFRGNIPGQLHGSLAPRNCYRRLLQFAWRMPVRRDKIKPLV
jgi:hypothetical protein